MGAKDILDLVGKLGGSAIESAFAPSPYQPRQSFRGSQADPTTNLAGIQEVLRGILGQASTRASMSSEDLMPSSHVGSDLPSFSGGGLPIPIGVTSAARSGHADLTTPPHLGTPNLSTGAMPGPRIVLPGDNTGDPGGGMHTTSSAGPGTGPGADAGAGAGTGTPYVFGSANRGGMGTSMLPVDAQTQGALKLLLHAAGLPEAG